MKTSTLCKILALAAALPLAALAESPDDSSTSKQGVGGNKEHLEASAPAGDAIVRRTDAVYIYRAGKPMKVESRTTTAEGFTVEPGGRVMWQNGREVILSEGQMVDFKGMPLHESPDRNAIQGSAGAKD